MDPTLVDCGTTKLGTPLKLNKHVVDADKVIIIDGITTSSPVWRRSQTSSCPAYRL